MVSTLPAWSFKNFKVPAEYVLPLLLGVGAYVARAADRALGGAGRWRACSMRACCSSRVRSYARLKREAEAMLEPVVVTSQDGRANG